MQVVRGKVWLELFVHFVFEFSIKTRFEKNPHRHQRMAPNRLASDDRIPFCQEMVMKGKKISSTYLTSASAYVRDIYVRVDTTLLNNKVVFFDTNRL